MLCQPSTLPSAELPWLERAFSKDLRTHCFVDFAGSRGCPPALKIRPRTPSFNLCQPRFCRAIRASVYRLEQALSRSHWHRQFEGHSASAPPPERIRGSRGELIRDLDQFRVDGKETVSAGMSRQNGGFL